MKKNYFITAALLGFVPLLLSANEIKSIDTKVNTAMKVRVAKKGTDNIIIGSDYNGVILATDYNGDILWRTKIADGTMNHDIWCADIDGDGKQEIFVANANGSLTCLDISGEKKWFFTPYDSVHRTPMYSVCVVKRDNKPYVVCGDFSTNCYYLDALNGKIVQTLSSKDYSKAKVFKTDKKYNSLHVANFLRPIPVDSGNDLLLIHGSNNHMQSSGEFYVMEPLTNKVLSSVVKPLKQKGTVGDVRVVDPDGDGTYEVIFGSSVLNENEFGRIEFSNNYTNAKLYSYPIQQKNIGRVSYRVNQPFILYGKSGYDYGVLSSNAMVFFSSEGYSKQIKDKLLTTFAYNDMCQDDKGNIILASCQDGGSCIHIINTGKSSWKYDYEELMPKGNIKRIMDYTEVIRKELNNFKKSVWQREPVCVTGFEKNNIDDSEVIINNKSLKLYDFVWNRGHCQIPDWRKPLYDNNIYQKKRDRRYKYDYNGQQLYEFFTNAFNNETGISTWGGHGNDPLFYQKELMERIADYGYENGKKSTIYIYPEMNNTDKDFGFVMENHIYPLVEYLETVSSKIAFRAKNVFWQGQVYTKDWEPIVSGKYAFTVIPILEETTDKTQDLSIAGRMGLWAAGSVDGWGVRCSRDDPSFDRSRQFSSQKLSNHVLRKTIYSLACGAKYIHNTVDSQNALLDYHASLAYELLAKEALFVPKRNEILSFSPVHISMVNPQESYLHEAEDNKWWVYFDKDKEENRPMVFSHMNASWLGGTLTPWDFSTYASGVVDRRQNTIPPYPNGMVLITPVQSKVLRENNSVRGNLADNLHPFYKSILKEYITDGVDYLSADGKERYRADEFYKQVKKDIEEGAKKLPVLVKGEKTGWVVAQVTPTHLRLTLVDGGYLSPMDRKVKVSLNNLSVKKVIDILDGTSYDINNDSFDVTVPCGMFKFIDIELQKPFM